MNASNIPDPAFNEWTFVLKGVLWATMATVEILCTRRLPKDLSTISKAVVGYFKDIWEVLR